MQIVFNLPHVFRVPASPADANKLHVDNALALRDLLNCMVALNLSFMRNNRCKPLYQSGVRYGRTVWWEPIPALYERKYGDCKSLATALIAQYHRAGIPAEPVFRWITNRQDGTDFHILVQTDQGFEDPSKVLGMGKNENERFFQSDGSVISWEASTGFYYP